MAEKATIEKVLPERASGENGHGLRDGREAPRDGTPRRRGGRKAKGEPGRWVREAKGILALALSGFGFVALYAFDPTLHPLDQSSPVGPVGAWLGWGSFHAFGYAGYLFPVLLALYGVSAFVRPRMAHGWQAAAGLGILLVSAAGILARASRFYNLRYWRVANTALPIMGADGSDKGAGVLLLGRRDDLEVLIRARHRRARLVDVPLVL